MVRKSYIAINDIIYEFESAIAAVDGCFKAFHVLRCDYPAETKPIWMFLQKYLYGLSTSSDTNYTSVTSLYSELSSIEI